MSKPRPEPRSASVRKTDTLAKLQAIGEDVWVASASASQRGEALPYLVPLSLAWIDDRVVVALGADSRTALNVKQSGLARLALGRTRDVVVIDATLDRAIPAEEIDADLAQRYAAQADWDPREERGDYVYLVLRPVRIQAWREANELTGRTLMRTGDWLV